MSCASNLFNSTRVPVRVSVNKLNLLPERISQVLLAETAEFIQKRLSSRKPYNPIVLLNPFMHAPACFANAYIA